MNTLDLLQKWEKDPMLDILDVAFAASNQTASIEIHAPEDDQKYRLICKAVLLFKTSLTIEDPDAWFLADITYTIHESMAFMRSRGLEYGFIGGEAPPMPLHHIHLEGGLVFDLVSAQAPIIELSDREGH